MSQPLKIGMIGLDTSHVPAFTKLLNDPDNEHHVPGGRVVAGYPGASEDFDASINRVEGFTKELRDNYGVQILDSPAAVAEQVDAVFITSVDGRRHLEFLKQTLPCKRPTFIDKPFAVSSADAREMFSLAQEAGVTLTSASALRFDEALGAALADDAQGKVVGCDAYGPMALQPTQPGLYWYGIHTVEIVNKVMGTGCEKVQADANDGVDVVTCTWGDGRVAVVRGNRNCHGQFGVVLHREQGAQHLALTGGGKPWYASLLEQVMPSLNGGKAPIEPEATLEIIRLIEAANESRETGQAVTV